MRKIKFICDGTASYKLNAEKFDRDFDGEYVLAKYFEDGTHEAMIAGVKQLIADKAVCINGYTLPTKVLEMRIGADDNYTYTINGKPAFTANPSNSPKEVLEMSFKAVEHVLKAAGTIVVLSVSYNGQAVSMAITITKGILSDTGEIVTVWEDFEGHHEKPADRLDGFLLGGADHEDYIFKTSDGETLYLKDANMFQRAFPVQNRPGGFVNTQNNFKLYDCSVTAWFIPDTLHSEKPMIIGFTSGKNAAIRLKSAIAYANSVIGNTVVAATRSEAGDGVNWVTDCHPIDELKSAIHIAQEALEKPELTPSDLDGAVYNLHLALWGSLHDISAVFMGNAQPGFFDIANPDVPKAPPVELRH